MTYTIVSVDSLSKISSRVYGTVDFKPLHKFNQAEIGDNPNRISVGQVLQISCLNADGSLATPAKADSNWMVLALEDKPVLPVLNDAGPEAAIESATTLELEDAAEADTGPQVDATGPEGPLVFTFNKTSAPPFIINSGVGSSIFIGLKSPK
ncbi:hypothetical protein N9L47_00100 [Rhodobacteraceae bacterium]|nr:hypothetical protein [Paracoccaceae bacterium]